MPATKPARLPAPSFRLSLHIRHPSIGPGDISRELQLEADEFFAAGEPRRPRSGAAPESVHCETYWAAALDPEHWLVSSAPAGSSSMADVPHVSAAADVPGAPRRIVIRHSQAQPGEYPVPPEAMHRWAAMAVVAGARNLGVSLSLVCARLCVRHGDFLRRLRSEGGSLTLRATISPRALQGFKIMPQVSQWMSELEMTLELEYLER